MRFIAVVIAIACACSSKSDAPPPDKGSAAVEVKPYTPGADVPEAIKQAIASPDRSTEDRALDAGRKPGEVLAWFRIGPGQRVAELFAGGGATTELLARVVGTKGQVFAQNTKEILDRFARKPWTDRAAKPVMKNVVRVDRPLGALLPPDRTPRRAS